MVWWVFSGLPLELRFAFKTVWCQILGQLGDPLPSVPEFRFHCAEARAFGNSLIAPSPQMRSETFPERAARGKWGDMVVLATTSVAVSPPFLGVDGRCLLRGHPCASQMCRGGHWFLLVVWPCAIWQGSLGQAAARGCSGRSLCPEPGQSRARLEVALGPARTSEPPGRA